MSEIGYDRLGVLFLLTRTRQGKTSTAQTNPDKANKSGPEAGQTQPTCLPTHSQTLGSGGNLLAH